ncbi:MAG: hypothetical protein R2795_18500 [Saprospiraceae bacterium]
MNGLGAGMFGVTVTDANGCTDTDLEILVAPPALTTSLNVTNESVAEQPMELLI